MSTVAGLEKIAKQLRGLANANYRVFILTDHQPSHDIAALKDQVLQKFPTVAPQTWGLTIRFQRSTANRTENKSSADTQFILRSSHFNDEAFLAIGVDEKSPVISIPAEQMDTYTKLLNDKFNTLWVTKGHIAVANGFSCEIDDVIIRVGELRSPGASQAVRGIICNVQISSSRTLESSQEKTARLIAINIAETLGFVDAKRYFRIWTGDSKFQEVKLWCEALNQRF
jgi:hypothetical protein